MSYPSRSLVLPPAVKITRDYLQQTLLDARSLVPSPSRSSPASSSSSASAQPDTYTPVIQHTQEFEETFNLAHSERLMHVTRCYLLLRGSPSSSIYEGKLFVSPQQLSFAGHASGNFTTRIIEIPFGDIADCQKVGADQIRFVLISAYGNKAYDISKLHAPDHTFAIILRLWNTFRSRHSGVHGATSSREIMSGSQRFSEHDTINKNFQRFYSGHSSAESTHSTNEAQLNPQHQQLPPPDSSSLARVDVSNDESGSSSDESPAQDLSWFEIFFRVYGYLGGIQPHPMPPCSGHNLLHERVHAATLHLSQTQLVGQLFSTPRASVEVIAPPQTMMADLPDSDVSSHVDDRDCKTPSQSRDFSSPAASFQNARLLNGTSMNHYHWDQWNGTDDDNAHSSFFHHDVGSSPAGWMDISNM